MVANVWRMMLAGACTALLCLVTMGSGWPVYAGAETWMWLLLSGVVGYFFGDWCLFNSYLTIGSRYGQLFMTLAPMFAALAAWVAMGQVLSCAASGHDVTSPASSSVSWGGWWQSRVSVQLPLKACSMA
jgi:drug/metabolite transporter (DMT)-like permease